mmetsp:Transcript_42332/g.66290  ORF Transcript_42332/g.66290 Transcript_42332/m.66290 type:complete len:80 (+) Transcript_42332:315-554(+)
MTAAAHAGGCTTPNFAIIAIDNEGANGVVIHLGTKPSASRWLLQQVKMFSWGKQHPAPSDVNLGLDRKSMHSATVPATA